MGQSAGVKGAAIWTMAIASGATVANLYYNQPLLPEIARTFAASDHAVGLIPTVTQIGYGLGMLLIVPLGLFLRLELPRSEPAAPMPYAALLRSLVALVREEPLLRLHSALGALTFGAFSAFWATLALYLRDLPPHYGPRTAGLFGVFGV